MLGVADGVIDGENDGKEVDGGNDGKEDKVTVGAVDGDSIGETVGKPVIVGDVEGFMDEVVDGASDGISVDVIVCSEEVDGLIVVEVIDEDLSDLLLPDFEEDNDLPILPDFALELSRFLDCRMAPLLLSLCCLSWCGCCFRSFIVLGPSMYC